MGYYAETIGGKFLIKAKNFDKAYDAICKLNAKDDLKEGFSCSYRKRPANSKSVSSNPRKHFSFMSWHYDEIFNDLFEVLKALGFDVLTNSDGDIDYIFFFDKLGREDLFLEAIAPYVESGSYIIWRGEDGSMWVHNFIEGKMIENEACLTW